MTRPERQYPVKTSHERTNVRTMPEPLTLAEWLNAKETANSEGRNRFFLLLLHLIPQTTTCRILWRSSPICLLSRHRRSEATEALKGWMIFRSERMNELRNSVGFFSLVDTSFSSCPLCSALHYEDRQRLEDRRKREDKVAWWRLRFFDKQKHCRLLTAPIYLYVRVHSCWVVLACAIGAGEWQIWIRSRREPFVKLVVSFEYSSPLRVW